MRVTYLQKTYRAIAATLTLLALGNCNIEVGNPDSNLPESMRSVQNLSFNLSVAGACSTTAETCAAVPVTFSGSQPSGITYEMTGVKFQLSGLQLKPYAENQLWTQLDLLRGSSVVIPESIDSTTVSAVALRFQGTAAQAARTFEISGNMVIGTGGERIVLPLNLVFDNALLAESAVSTPGGIIAGVEFDAATWFDFSDIKGDFSNILKNLTSGACRVQDSTACADYRETIARQVSRRISRSMAVKSRPAAKASEQKGRNP